MYRCEIKILSRAAGHSVVAAAAYRSGERFQDIQAARVRDYTAIRDRVSHREIIAPDDFPTRLRDRERLWNHVEHMEKRRDAQLAREFLLSLPHELNHTQRVALVRDFVRAELLSQRMVADVILHDPVPGAGDERNFHAHILTPLRQATPTGLRAVKTREWNSRAQLRDWRAAWADHVNRALAAAQVSQRVTHRALHDQRDDAVSRGDVIAMLRLNREPEPNIGKRAYHRPESARDRDARRNLIEMSRQSAQQAMRRAENLRHTYAQLRLMAPERRAARRHLG